ncbi:MAG: ABC transporter substrate-binding protein [Synergistaceae bacterium]|nr:ABC transporter substrate-binding protein [Synergistaceae bacterium]
MKKIFVSIAIFFIFIASVSAEELRVISLYPGHSDNIFAMGGERILIALSENDDTDLLPDLPRLSLRDNAEKFLALKPDIVVTRSLAIRLNPNLYEILERAGVKIIDLDPPSWNDFENYLKVLANSLGLNSEKAIEKLSKIKISSQSSSLTYHCFIEATSKEIHTCSPSSWAANLILLAGGINAASEAEPLRSGSSIAAWGVERVLKSLENKNLDIYIIQTGAMNNASIKDFYNREWTKILIDNGVKAYEVPEKYLSRPSLIGLEKGLEILRKILSRSDD